MAPLSRLPLFASFLLLTRGGLRVSDLEIVFARTPEVRMSCYLNTDTVGNW